MKPHLRIPVKDYSRNKSLKVLLHRSPFATPQFFVTIGDHPHLTPALSPPSEGAEREQKRWPKSGRPVSLTRVFTALRKAVVRSV